MDAERSARYFEASGMRALIRAGDRPDWFFGHFGAAFLAGAQLLRHESLPLPARAALAAALSGLEADHRDWFEPLDASGSPAGRTEPLLRTLRDHAHRLRNSGHGTIYLVSALRAFAQRPELATARCIDALLALHAAAQHDERTRYLNCADYFAVADRAKPVTHAPTGLQDAIGAAFQSCQRVTPDVTRNGRRHFLFGEKIHVLTHINALHQLHQLGHPDIALAGLSAHRVQIELGEVPEHEHAPVTPPSTLHPALPRFWEAPSLDVWHKIKLAEAVTTLLPLLPADARSSARRAVAGMWALLASEPQSSMRRAG